jgi:hypothetical protein
MAHAIARTIMRRASDRGRLRSALDVSSTPMLRPTPDGLESHDLDELERPPLQLVRDPR